MKYEISIEKNAGEGDFVIEQTRKYNAQYVPNDFIPLSVYCRPDSRLTTGGLRPVNYKIINQQDGLIT